jgi:hypothetical protein
MRFRTCFVISLVAGALIGFSAMAQTSSKMMMVAPLRPGLQAANADVVVIGKVVEIEKETVEVSPFKGAPKDQKVSYKIAVVKIEEAIIGGKGLTQFRVGFLDVGAAPPVVGDPVPPGAGVRPIRVVRPGRAPVALMENQEGCFYLSPHPVGDFYVLAGNGTVAPINIKDENYKKQLEEIKKVAKTLDDPVTALKAKELSDRFEAAQVLLQRYSINRSTGTASREPIPTDENKLILAVLKELPWAASETKPRTPLDPVPPSRSALWYSIQVDMVGFKQPVFPVQKPGDPPVDSNKIWEDATSAYLKDNIEKIKIKRFAK